MKPALLRVAYDVGCPAAAFAIVVGSVWIARSFLGPPDDEAPFATIGLAVTGFGIVVAGLLIAWRTRGASLWSG